MTPKRTYSPTFRLSAWSVAMMAVFAACGYIGSLPWGLWPRVLFITFGVSVAWVVAAYMAKMPTTVKAVLLTVLVLLTVVALVLS